MAARHDEPRTGAVDPTETCDTAKRERYQYNLRRLQVAGRHWLQLRAPDAETEEH